MEQTPTVGLFLGMGAVAGAYFYQCYEKEFVGLSDEHRPRLIAYSYRTNSDVPLAIDINAKFPSDSVMKGVDFFKKNNVDFIVCPCNTLMQFKEVIEDYSDIQLLDIIDITVKHIIRNSPTLKRVGVLSTTLTASWKLYEKAFVNNVFNCELIFPDEIQMQEIDKLIKEVKLGFHYDNEQIQRRLKNVFDCLIVKGVDLIVLGCTELPCIYDEEIYKSVAILNTSKILAKASVHKAKFINSNNKGYLNEINR